MSDVQPDCAFLSACTDAYRDATLNAARLRAQLSQRQLTWKPDDQTWSVLENIEHLSLTVGRQIGKLRVGVLDTRARGFAGGTPPFGRGTWAGRYIIGALQRDKPVKSFKRFDPTHATPGIDEVFTRFRKANQELSRLALEADGLDLGKVKVGSAPTNLMKLSVAQAFRIQALHHARHLAQAEALRELDAFPTA